MHDTRQTDFLSRLPENQGKAIDWAAAAATLPSRSNKDCRKRWYNTLMGGLRKGPWEESEDAKLRDAVLNHGEQCVYGLHRSKPSLIQHRKDGRWTAYYSKRQSNTDEHGRTCNGRSSKIDRRRTSRTGPRITRSDRTTRTSMEGPATEDLPRSIDDEHQEPPSRRASHWSRRSVGNDSCNPAMPSPAISYSGNGVTAPLNTADACFPLVESSSTPASLPSADKLFAHTHLPPTSDLFSHLPHVESTTESFPSTVDHSDPDPAFAGFWADVESLIENNCNSDSADGSPEWFMAHPTRSDISESHHPGPGCSNALVDFGPEQELALHGFTWPAQERSSNGSPTCQERNRFVLTIEDPSPTIITQVTNFLVQSQSKFKMEMR
nr:hypothetical protein CFP56_42223 [Quercus suber]